MTITRVLLTAALLTRALTAKDFSVKLADGKGQPVGTAKISDKKGGGVEIKLDIKNLAPGEHALHFHGIAKCEGPRLSAPWCKVLSQICSERGPTIRI